MVFDGGSTGSSSCGLVIVQLDTSDRSFYNNYPGGREIARMIHFFFYALSVSLYTAAVFAAGMYVGEKLERAWGNRLE